MQRAHFARLDPHRTVFLPRRESNVARRIGDILREIVPLSTIDIEEILLEQRTTHRRFGDCAISLGHCRPNHVWQAFTDQLDGSVHIDNLDTFGIDTQAISHIPTDIARQLGVVPVRIMDAALVIATIESNVEMVRPKLADLVALPLYFVTAPSEQIERAIARYYPGLRAAG
jgi:Type II secretion system (T2SS), protein E, N-terminal domain